MKISFKALDYALMSPRHQQVVIAGLIANNGPDFIRAHVPQAAAIVPLEVTRSQSGDDDETPWWETEDIYGDKLPVPQMRGNTAVVPVKGVITSGLPRIYRALGFVDAPQIAGWIRACAEDPAVLAIVLDIDSPGGMVTGTPELADEVAAAAARKSVVAHTSGTMCSAAYWIASQAAAIFCTRSADVGCVGVYQVHYDYSACLKDMGIDAEIFKSGDLKAAGHPDIPLTDDQRGHIQSQIDLIGEQFRGAVKSKRAFVDDDSMRGQSFIGTEAAKRNLVNGLRSLSDVLGPGSKAAKAAVAQWEGAKNTKENRFASAASEPDPRKRAQLFADASEALAAQGEQLSAQQRQALRVAASNEPDPVIKSRLFAEAAAGE